MRGFFPAVDVKSRWIALAHFFLTVFESASKVMLVTRVDSEAAIPELELAFLVRATRDKQFSLIRTSFAWRLPENNSFILVRGRDP